MIKPFLAILAAVLVAAPTAVAIDGKQAQALLRLAVKATGLTAQGAGPDRRRAAPAVSSAARDALRPRLPAHRTGSRREGLPCARAPHGRPGDAAEDAAGARYRAGCLRPGRPDRVRPGGQGRARGGPTTTRACTPGSALRSEACPPARGRPRRDGRRDGRDRGPCVAAPRRAAGSCQARHREQAHPLRRPRARLRLHGRAAARRRPAQPRRNARREKRAAPVPGDHRAGLPSRQVPPARACGADRPPRRCRGTKAPKHRHVRGAGRARPAGGVRRAAVGRRRDGLGRRSLRRVSRRDDTTGLFWSLSTGTPRSTPRSGRRPRRPTWRPPSATGL